MRCWPYYGLAGVGKSGTGLHCLTIAHKEDGAEFRFNAKSLAGSLYSTCCSCSAQNTIEIVKRMDEIRLMESRKSLRLMESHDVDFARLAEGGHTASPANADQQPAQQQLQLQLQQQQPRKRNCSNSTSGIDVPGAYVG